MAKVISVATGNSHIMEVTRKRGLFVITIDGRESSSFKPNLESQFFVMHEDFPIAMDGEEYILSIRGAKFRLVLSGRYVDDGSEFKSAKHLPVWFWILGVIDLMVLILGGAIGAILGYLVANRSAVIARTNLPTALRILLCLLLTITLYAVFFIITIIISSYRY